MMKLFAVRIGEKEKYVLLGLPWKEALAPTSTMRETHIDDIENWLYG